MRTKDAIAEVPLASYEHFASRDALSGDPVGIQLAPRAAHSSSVKWEQRKAEQRKVKPGAAWMRDAA